MCVFWAYVRDIPASINLSCFVKFQDLSSLPNAVGLACAFTNRTHDGAAHLLDHPQCHNHGTLVSAPIDWICHLQVPRVPLKPKTR